MRHLVFWIKEENDNLFYWQFLKSEKLGQFIPAFGSYQKNKPVAIS